MCWCAGSGEGASASSWSGLHLPSGPGQGSSLVDDFIRDESIDLATVLATKHSPKNQHNQCIQRQNSFTTMEVKARTHAALIGQ